jgi:lysophospholipase L1-like esterase
MMQNIKKILWVSIAIPLISSSLFAVETIKIMPLGDSITHENYRDSSIADNTPEADRSAYRNSLDYLLHDNNYTFDFVGSQVAGDNIIPPFDTDHEGYDGETDTGIAANVYDYLTANPADVVLLHIGTNSATADNSPNNVASILDEIDRYETSNSKHVKVLLARIIGCWENWTLPAGVYPKCDAEFNAHIDTFNNNVEAMVNTRISTKGDDLVMVDMQNGAGFNYDATDMIDDLHPNDTGYAKMANLWYASLQDVLPAHQWSLNEATSPYLDTYKSLNDATCSAPGCPLDVEGIVNQAKEFDGNDDNISIAHNASYDWNETESFSVEFWMKPDYKTNLQVAIGHFNHPSPSWWIGREGSKIRAEFGGASITSDVNVNISGKRWIHVAVVRNTKDNSLKLYINGVEDTQSLTNITPKAYSGTNPIQIGYFDHAFNYSGALDEIAIYDGILSPAQIKLHNDRGQDGSIFIQHNWKLDEIGTATYYEDAWDPNTFARTGSTVRPSEVVGQIGNARHFDGSEALWVEDSDSLDWYADDNFTIEVWAKPDVIGEEMIILGRRGYQHPTNVYHHMAWVIGINPDGTPFIFFRGEEPENNYPRVVINGQNALTPNTWYHFSVVRDAGNTFTFYIDGVEIGSTPDTLANIVAETEMSIGYVLSPDDGNKSNGYDGNATHFFHGTIDDIAIFGNPLDTADIQNHYNKGVAGLGFEDADTNIPVITLIGSPSITIERTTPYTDAGAAASDDVDGNISSNISTNNPVDENVTGIYTITYNVLDFEGNAAVAVTRTVTVVDTIAPTISESTPITTPTSDTTPNYIFYSTEEGNITYGGDCSSSTTTAILGENNITFNALADNTYTNCTITVTDLEGLISNVLHVSDFVIDIQPPTLTEITPIATPTADTTPDYTFSSSEAGTIAYVGDCTSSMTTAIAGNNTITFDALTTGEHSNCIIRVTDAASNEFTELTVSTFTVDDIAPVISRTGDETINLLVNQTYIEAGATCTDNYDAACSVTIGGDVVDTSAIGNFTVTYNTNDTAGNAAATVTRTVNVATGNAPVITIAGDNPLTIEVNTPYIEPGASADDLEDGTNVTLTSDALSSIHTDTLGTQTVTYVATDSQGNVVEETRTVNVVDTTKPIITLTGTSTINLLVYETYTEDGATCTDNYDTICNVTIGGDSVDTSTVGTYIVTYDVNDTEGNSATQVTRTITIADTTKPIISLVGTSQVLEVGTPYTELGATATDNADGTLTNITIDASSVDIATVGTYTVTYDVNDSSGNAATQVKRFINIVDTTKPIITLNGSNSVNLLIGESYNELGATCTDNYDTSCNVTVSGTVNTASTGNYQLTYATTDSEGNNAITLTRTVNVTTSNAPQITVSGDNPLVITVGTTYVEPGVSATDAEDGSKPVFSDFLTAINTSNVGTQILTYFSTDSEGNTAVATRTIIVLGTTGLKNDFNNDQTADILWRKGSTNHLWTMNTDGTHTYINIGTKSSTYAITGMGDFNADGITDILWRKGDRNYIWYMHSDGTHDYKKITSKSYNVMAVEDFNGDGIADILWRKNNQNHIWYMHADGSHTYKNIGTKSTTYTISGTGDLNGDGITDILWRKGYKNYIWYMNSDGTHAYKKITSKSYNVMAIEDFNGDGIADILWRKDNQNNIWYMNADGTYTYKNIGTKGIEFTLTKTADYNGDGITDILWKKDSSNYLWYMHADGSHTYKKISGKSTAYSVQ